MKSMLLEYSQRVQWEALTVWNLITCSACAKYHCSSRTLSQGTDISTVKSKELKVVMNTTINDGVNDLPVHYEKTLLVERGALILTRIYGLRGGQ